MEASISRFMFVFPCFRSACDRLPRSALLHQRALALLHRPVGLVARDGAENFVIVVWALGLLGLLDPHEIHVAHDAAVFADLPGLRHEVLDRSEEHTSELQSLMRISYAVF